MKFLCSAWLPLALAWIAIVSPGQDSSTPRPETDAQSVARARCAEGAEAKERGDLARGLAAYGEAVDVLVGAQESIAPKDLAIALLAMAGEAQRAGFLPPAERALRSVLEICGRTLPPCDPTLRKAEWFLAYVVRDQGDFGSSRAICLAWLAKCTPADSARDRDAESLELLLANTLMHAGDLAGARERQERILAVRERNLPPDHLDLQVARGDLANTLRMLGDRRRALELQQQVFEAYSRTLGKREHRLLQAQTNLAIHLAENGELERSVVLLREVYAIWSRSLPEGHPDLETARQFLAFVSFRRGSFLEARDLYEKLLEVRLRTQPENSASVQSARLELGMTLRDMGDFPGSRSLIEAGIAGYEQILPPDHPNLLRARMELALTLRNLGDFQGARNLLEEVIRVRESVNPNEDLELPAVRANLASVLNDLGDFDAAQALEESVLEVWERTRPDDDHGLLMARLNHGGSLWRRGRLEEGRALREQAVEVAERVLPDGNAERCLTLGELAISRAEADDPGALADVLGRLEEQVARLVEGATSLAPREARAVTASLHDYVSLLLSFSAMIPREADDVRRTFALVESIRDLDGAPARSAYGDSSRTEIQQEIVELGSRIADLLREGRESGADRHAIGARMRALVRERDLLESRLLRGGATNRSAGPRLDVVQLAAKLPEDAAAVGYVRYRWAERTGTRTGPATDRWREEDRFLAHVLVEGRVARVDLGSARAIEDAVCEWRAAIGRPLPGGGAAPSPASAPPERGVTPGTPGSSTDGAMAAGRKLAARILDPVIAAAGKATTWFVCIDDVLGLVPLDALPSGANRVGDSLAIRLVPSFRRWDPRADPRRRGDALVLVGGVDFDRAAEDEVAEESMDRSRGGSEPWLGLPGSQREVESIGELGARSGSAAVVLLSGSNATRSALIAASPRARWLHIATHGFFLRESSLASDGGSSTVARAPMSFEQTVVGFAPGSLCGIVLAGANRRGVFPGESTGIVTAEELASFDLGGCELAVLAACESNLGIRSAGQVTRSLQTALHEAGARSVITSAWPVDDEATRRLMEGFYRRLWEGKESIGVALWDAKMDEARRGRPESEWAGWVLSTCGDE